MESSGTDGDGEVSVQEQLQAESGILEILEGREEVMLTLVHLPA